MKELETSFCSPIMNYRKEVLASGNLMELFQVPSFNHSSMHCPCFPFHGDNESKWKYSQLYLHISCLGIPTSCLPLRGGIECLLFKPHPFIFSLAPISISSTRSLLYQTANVSLYPQTLPLIGSFSSVNNIKAQVSPVTHHTHTFYSE